MQFLSADISSPISHSSNVQETTARHHAQMQDQYQALCYADASHSASHATGIGVVATIKLPQFSASIKIQATSMATDAVEAEAQAVLLSSTIFQNLQIRDCLILSDNRAVIQAINSEDQFASTVKWQLKPTIRLIKQKARDINATYQHISRNYNQRADKLARDASLLKSTALSCTNPNHIYCPIVSLFSSCVFDVTIRNVTCSSD